jgi:hypothetical protein
MNDNFKKLLSRVEELKKSGNYDLSLEEDLSIAIMNLISLEEHFFMTAKKTGKKEYLKLHQDIRKIRGQLLAKMVPQHEGETWCITKHLLAATMRLIEVGDKYQSSGKPREAGEMFDLAYKIYSLFWSLRLNLIKMSDLPEVSKTDSWSLEEIISKLVDCCKE